MKAAAMWTWQRKKITGLLLAAPVAALLLVPAYFALWGFASWRQGYSWAEMDWRQRGHTSLADFFAASDIGKRDVQVDNQRCTEYFAYKDGMPVKVVCGK